ncbi:hypothetical protein BGZ49_000415 [Haplosporangium sp. Z 27]|nr:hypothetical protein BGZ49_000415 [Haplosporangium sp. Z 27]
MPSNIDQANVTSPGSSIPAGIIGLTAGIPKQGYSGILFDMGYACTPGFDANNTLPPPKFYDLPRIALIQRGSPTQDPNCTFRTKLLNAIANNSIAAIIYNVQGSTEIDRSTAQIPTNSTAVGIPGMMISYDDGMMLRNLLQQTEEGGNVDFYNRIRVNMSIDQKMPLIWEFVLIIVVVLLAVSLTVSVVLHCRLYALRQRVRMDALARGADVLPNGTIRMRKITLDKSILDDIPTRVYGQDQASSRPTPEATVAVATATTPSPEECSNNRNSMIQGISVDNTGTPTINKPSSFASLSRVNSHKGSISGQSIRSIRSIRAIEAAAALNATTQQEPAIVSNTSTSEEGEETGETCAVCLEDFSDGEEIRILPCHHEFHCECIDPWLTRKSSTCPLCKYDCMPQTTEEVEGRGEDANIVVPNDRLIEFIMGPDWVAARTLRGHNGNSYIDRTGHFFGTLYDRARGRPPRPFPTATVSPTERRTRVQQEAVTPSRLIPLDENGQVPLQFITPSGISAVPAIETSTIPTADPTSAPTLPSAPESSLPSVTINISESSNSQPALSTAEKSEESKQTEAEATAVALQTGSDLPVAVDIPAAHDQAQ